MSRIVSAACGAAVALCAWALAPAADAGTTATGVQLVEVDSFNQPTYADDAPGFPDLLFVTEKEGTVQVLDGEVTQSEPFLDISGRVASNGEQGLLSIAFPPDYQDSRRFYVYYTTDRHCAGGCDIEVDEFKRSKSDPLVANPESRRKVIRISHRDASNHNGGEAAFGLDGKLWLATGDGGAGDDVFDNASRLDRPLGKLLRINPVPKNPAKPGYRTPSDNPYAGKDGLDEIWAYGLRNPFRFSFDSMSGTIAIGDVGQSTREEVDITTVGDSKGVNFGWPAFEADVPGPTPEHEGPDPATPPMYAYDNPPGPDPSAVTGGLIVRDPSLPPSLQGRYLFADFYSGQLMDFIPDMPNNEADDVQELGVSPVMGPVAFTAGVGGQVYVTALIEGVVYRLEPVV
jgi:glucose/arabinose dehydrogenase